MPFPESSGQASQLTNIGEVENKGWEINTQFFLLNKRNIDLRINASVNTLENTVVSNGGAAPFSVGGFTFLGQFVDEANRSASCKATGLPLMTRATLLVPSVTRCLAARYQISLAT